MCGKIQSKKLKQATLTAEMVKVSSSILVQNIEREDVDEDLLSLYFSNSKKSGGCEVEDVRLIGDGKAIITFAESKGNSNNINS